nr:recombinase RecT [Providencia rettgeri]
MNWNCGDEIVKVYSFARLTSGEMVIEVMSRNEIERVRDVATSRKANSVWDKWFDRMALMVRDLNQWSNVRIEGFECYAFIKFWLFIRWLAMRTVIRLNYDLKA